MINFKYKKIINSLLFASLFLNTDISDARGFFSKSEKEDEISITNRVINNISEDSKRDLDPAYDFPKGLPYDGRTKIKGDPKRLFDKKPMEKDRYLTRSTTQLPKAKSILDCTNEFGQKGVHFLWNKDDQSKGKEEGKTADLRRFFEKQNREIDHAMGKIKKSLNGKKAQDQKATNTFDHILKTVSKVFNSLQNEDKETESEEEGLTGRLLAACKKQSEDADRVAKSGWKIWNIVSQAIDKKSDD